jgi:hypothetical protein
VWKYGAVLMHILSSNPTHTHTHTCARTTQVTSYVLEALFYALPSVLEVEQTHFALNGKEAYVQFLMLKVCVCVYVWNS